MTPRRWLTSISVACFAVVTAALLLPGYVERARTPPPTDSAYYVSQLIQTRERVFGVGNSFGRIPAGTELADIELFECSLAQDAQREFGWRGAYEQLLDCIVLFRDTERRPWAGVIRLWYDGESGPEGYGWNIPAHIDKAQLLIDRGVLPLR